MELGDSASLIVTVRDTSGAIMTGTTIRWSTNDASVALIGQNGVGRAVGVGTTKIVVESQGIAANVTVTVGVALISVETGANHTCGVTASGFVACWGNNGAGKLGTGTLFGDPSPSLVVPTFRDPQGLSLASSHSCALGAFGSVYCWGSNSSGQLGTGEVDGAAHPIPVRVSDTLTFASVTTGSRHVCALTFDGSAYCWGSGALGQLGVGTPRQVCNVTEPCEVRPALITGFSFAVLDAGQDHTCGVTTAGEGYCWGDNFSGVLGNNSDTIATRPALVEGGITFATISASALHSCGLSVSGEAYCWGINNEGQFGSGSNTSSFVPVAVAGNLTFASISAGFTHTCGITLDGTLYCWGANLNGQLGIGSRTAVVLPTKVASGETFVTVATGDAHSCALATSGSVYCWGDNLLGQLGIGPGPDQLTPVLVGGQ